jgi:hypothetical protein
MSDLFESLKQLKDKLSSMEETYETKSHELEKRARVNEDIDKKLDKLATIQTDIIKVEAGGKIYETTRSTIENCTIDNILRDKITNKFNNVIEYVNNEPIKSSGAVFIDIGSKDFKLILKFLRHIASSDERFNVYYDDSDDRERLEIVFNYFFKNDEKLGYLINYIPRFNTSVNSSSKSKAR